MTYKIIVPLSGGKDSQACLVRALEECDRSEILGLFCDTGYEHPWTYAHIEYMRWRYNIEITTVQAGTIWDEITKAKMFPGTGGAKHCTDRLKIRPSRDFYRDLSLKQGGFEVWLGMRADESRARAKRYAGKINTELYEPHEVLGSFPKYLGKRGVRFRLPIIDWSTPEVMDYVMEDLNPLYGAGFPRVGCFPCLALGDAGKARAFKFDETGHKHFKIAEDLEKTIGKSMWASKGGLARSADFSDEVNNGCSFCSM